MPQRAEGHFEVTGDPQPYDTVEGVTLARSRLEKRFHGDLQGASDVEMLSAIAGDTGSAGYVAIERVSGTLGGRSGSFVLQHNGTLLRGAPSLTVSVVPDSGTGALEGIAGEMQIDITPEGHRYTFDYTLEAVE
ncbi:MAG: DUF3224 family protein [Dehalococcoidia bacterium]|nr:DUF3224 family protein [Dehalococcoidia bacterium]